MALINKKTGQLIIVENVFFNTNKIQIKTYANTYSNSESIIEEVGVYLSQEFESMKSQLIIIGENKLLESNPDLIKEEDYVIVFPKEGEEGYNYKYRFFVSNEQLNVILVDYRELSKSLFEGIVNPMLPLDNGRLIYVNTFGIGAREMLEAGGIKIEENNDIKQ